MNDIKDIIGRSIAVKEAVLQSEELLETLQTIIDEIIAVYANGGKVLLCGNGGSAADAQHVAAELSGRFYFDREPLYAEALHVNTSYLTAVANDYDYDEIFARMVRAAGRKGDMLIGYSTSGNSGNIVRAFDDALEIGMKTVLFSGKTGGKLKERSCYAICVPSTDTPRIQECHIMLSHIMCELVEKKIFTMGN